MGAHFDGMLIQIKTTSCPDYQTETADNIYHIDYLLLIHAKSLQKVPNKSTALSHYAMQAPGEHAGRTFAQWT